MPDETRLFMCHDYKAPGRDEYRWETTVGDEKRHNVHVNEGVTEDDFAAMRTARDKTLGMPPADLAVGAGEHARGPDAAAGGERPALSENSRRRILSAIAPGGMTEEWR